MALGLHANKLTSSYAIIAPASAVISAGLIFQNGGIMLDVSRIFSIVTKGSLNGPENVEITD